MNDIGLKDVSPEELAELHAKGANFPLPDLNNLLYCQRLAVQDLNGKIIAIALVRLTSEAMIVVDPESPRTERARAISLLNGCLQMRLLRMGMDECHVFVDNPQIEGVLRRLGFISCSGKPMVLHLEGANGEKGT